MKAIWILLLLGCPATALTQAPASQETTTGADAAEAATPCVPAGEPVSEDGTQGDGAGVAEPCEDPTVESDPAEVADDNFADLEMQTTGDDVTAQEEVESGEEISEDFPVPLPSDI